MKYNIHIFGGLGAQLSGIFVERFINEKYKSLKTSVYLHNDPNFEFSYAKDGNELNSYKEKILVLHDYLVPKHLRNKEYSKLTISLSYSRRILNRIRLAFIYVDNLQTLSEWTPRPLIRNLQISEVTLDSEVEEFARFAFDLNLEAKIVPIFVSHWRLGDLYLRSKKSAGEQEKFVEFLSKLLNDNNVTTQYIFSDSPELVRNFLEERINKSNAIANLDIIGAESPAWDILNLGCQAQIFVGTYSKLSLWVAAIRCSRGLGGSTFLPTRQSKEFHRLFPKFPMGTIQEFDM